MSNKETKVVKTTEFVGHVSRNWNFFYFDTRLPEQINLDKKLGDTPERLAREDEAWIHAKDLLPDIGKQRGRWRITVEFTPEELTDKP